MGLACVIAACIIGFTRPALTQDAYPNPIICSAAWHKSVMRDTAAAAESSCAALTSERFVWATTLAAVGGGLLLCALPWQLIRRRSPKSSESPQSPESPDAAKPEV